MALDWNNDYTSAGPGHKRRVQRLTLDTIPKTIATAKAKPEYRRNRKPAQQEPLKVSGRDLRNKIIKLTLQLGSFGDIVERLDSENYGPASKVLISSVRDHAMTVLKVIMAEGLITEKQLARYRADAKDAQRRRFKRRD
jgi:hypothetical protein